MNNTQVLNTDPWRSQYITNLRNSLSVTEEVKLLRILYQHLIVLDQEDMSLNQLLTPQSITISQDGHCQRLEELMKIREDPIEIRLSILDLLLVDNQYPKIELGKNAISDPVIDSKRQN
jgi:hypothetical protein|tara:strand:- start:205 stop:561 length:357 start_codon:yes stop_codon:yes gene_type:complete